LPRSVDFDPFAQVFYPSYPNETARPLILDLIQMPWDRGEPNGFAGAILQSDDCGGGPCFAGGFTGP
jgi:hypothetical protein